jgi:hypothetical protein
MPARSSASVAMVRITRRIQRHQRHGYLPLAQGLKGRRGRTNPLELEPAERLGVRRRAPAIPDPRQVERRRLYLTDEFGIALFRVVAWRIAHLMRLGRTCPDLDATLFFDPDEIRGAYLLVEMKQPAKPTLNEVLRLIARLGGFIGRKSDGEPGVKTIWCWRRRRIDPPCRLWLTQASSPKTAVGLRLQPIGVGLPAHWVNSASAPTVHEHYQSSRHQYVLWLQ